MIALSERNAQRRQRKWRTGGAMPVHRGPCLCGCGRPGGRRTGYALRCWQTLSDRRRRLARLLTETVGEDIPLRYLRDALSGPAPVPDEARRLALILVTALDDGRLALIRRQRPTWLWSDPRVS